MAEPRLLIATMAVTEIFDSHRNQINLSGESDPDGPLSFRLLFAFCFDECFGECENISKYISENVHNFRPIFVNLMKDCYICSQITKTYKLWKFCQ